MSNKPKMVTGFNHNIKHGGQIYHVQTEDSGVDNPHIITHLFVGGNILATKKTSYADIVRADNLQDIVKELMQEQHKAMLRNLINGVYDDIATSSVSAPALSPVMPIGTEPALPDKFPAPVAQQEKATSTKPIQAETKATPANPSSASVLLPKSVPTTPRKPPAQPTPAQPPTESQQQTPQTKAPTVVPVTAPPVTTPPVTTPPVTTPQGSTLQASEADTVKIPVAKPPEPTAKVGSAGGFSRPKTSPKIFLPKNEMEKIPPSTSAKPKVAIQAKNRQKTQESKPASSANLPPEVLAARRLEEKPKPKDTSGPTIFGENLISEKSLDEVILGYLAGNDDDKA